MTRRETPSRLHPVAADHAAEHSARLRVVADRYSLSEIARRTGFPVSCIHSYLNGTRVPAELFTRLVIEFGVNPNWLHTGDGPAWSADVAPQTASMAADVLQLVEAMDAVAKVRLGALSGAQPLVRELDDALNSHERLQRKVSERTRALLAQLTSEGDDALRERRMDVARVRVAAAARLARLCDDGELKVRMLNQQAMLARLSGKPRDAVGVYREAFLHALPMRALLGEDCHMIAFNFSSALQFAGELRESAAVCDSMLILGEQRESPTRAMLSFQRGWLDLVSGELHRGLNRMSAMLPLVDPGLRVRVEAPKYMVAQIFAGLLEPDTAETSVPDSPTRNASLMSFALCADDIDRLAHYRQTFFGGDSRFLEDASGKLGGKSPFGHILDCVLRAARAQDRQAAHDYEAGVDPAMFPGSDEYFEFTKAVSVCQIARLAGDRRHALRKLDAADSGLRALPGAVTPNPFELARHYRNALELAGRARREHELTARARRWFSEWVANGYLLFRDYAAAQS